MEKAEERVVSNIVKIRTIRNITKRAMADSIGVGEVTYARIENGTIALSYDYLSRIASSFNMREIDIITYYLRKQNFVRNVKQCSKQKDKRNLRG